MALFSINSQKDYRYDMEKDGEEANNSYISPVDDSSTAKIDKLGQRLTQSTKPLF